MDFDLEKKLKTYLNNDDFLVKLFDAVRANFYSLTNPIRLNNFAYSMRELLRLFFEQNAPVDEIERCSWFKNETNKPGKISRKERYLYYMQGGVEDSMLPKGVADSKNRKATALKNRIDELSKFTHIQESTFNLSEDECNDKYQKVLVEITGIFETALELRNEVKKTIHDNICEVVRQTLWENIPDEVDLLSTHSTVEEVDDIEFTITNICSDRLFIEGTGSLGCDLQWGSNSDMKSGEGAQEWINLPMDFKGELPISNMKDGKEFEFTVNVDDSKWYGIEDEQDYGVE